MAVREGVSDGGRSPVPAPPSWSAWRRGHPTGAPPALGAPGGMGMPARSQPHPGAQEEGAQDAVVGPQGLPGSERARVCGAQREPRSWRQEDVPQKVNSTWGWSHGVWFFPSLQFAEHLE